MAITVEDFQPKKGPERPIRIVGKKSVLVQGTVLAPGKQVRVPAEDAHDLVHAGQAEYLDLKK